MVRNKNFKKRIDELKKTLVRVNGRPLYALTVLSTTYMLLEFQKAEKQMINEDDPTNKLSNEKYTW